MVGRDRLRAGLLGFAVLEDNDILEKAVLQL
jgi:hypothetical protein